MNERNASGLRPTDLLPISWAYPVGAVSFAYYAFEMTHCALFAEMSAGMRGAVWLLAFCATVAAVATLVGAFQFARHRGVRNEERRPRMDPRMDPRMGSSSRLRAFGPKAAVSAVVLAISVVGTISLVHATIQYWKYLDAASTAGAAYSTTFCAVLCVVSFASGSKAVAAMLPSRTSSGS